MPRKQKDIYRQGIYKPLTESKCNNTSPVEYRSQLEFDFFHKLDRSPNIIRWESETVKVPYINPWKSYQFKKKYGYHKDISANYYVDLLVETKNHGILLVEIKPQKEINAIEKNKPPKRTKRKKESTYMYELKMFEINKAKWMSANEYAQARGWSFVKVSEKNLREGKVEWL